MRTREEIQNEINEAVIKAKRNGVKEEIAVKTALETSILTTLLDIRDLLTSADKNK